MSFQYDTFTMDSIGVSDSYVLAEQTSNPETNWLQTGMGIFNTLVDAYTEIEVAEIQASATTTASTQQDLQNPTENGTGVVYDPYSGRNLIGGANQPLLYLSLGVLGAALIMKFMD